MAQDYPTQVKRWEVFEVQLAGTEEGNPFTEQTLTGIFSGKDESVKVNGFYDGDGIYRIRFMPSFEGKYTFALRASFIPETLSGTFFVTAADENNHGPVRRSGTYHFAYEDGTSYNCMGTTSYVWHLQSEEKKQETLKSLEESSFNKMRFCVFPKHYIYNFSDPACFPYEGTPMDCSLLTEENFMHYAGKAEGNDFEYDRFNPEYFRNIEKQIEELGRLGIEADLILFHPYDRWGFSAMSAEEDRLYLKYVINRFAAYHNVWWAMANEWDLLGSKTDRDWEDLAAVLVKYDPYHHLRSIHNCRQLYDHNRPWITHVSYQRVDLYKGAELTDELRETYQKPVVNDEIGYEGNIQFGWGSLPAEEMTRRFWETAVRGGYPGHSETVLNEEESLWWSHGGKLRGESAKRMAFLKEITDGFAGGIEPHNTEWDCICGTPEEEWMNPVKSQYLYYYSFMRPSFRDYHIDEATDYVAEVIDTWNMTVKRAGIFHGNFRLELPGTPYIAVRLRKAEEEDYNWVEPVEEIEEPETAEETQEETVFPDPFREVLPVEETVEEEAEAADETTVIAEEEALAEEVTDEAAEEDTAEEELIEEVPAEEENEAVEEEEETDLPEADAEEEAPFPSEAMFMEADAEAAELPADETEDDYLEATVIRENPEVEALEEEAEEVNPEAETAEEAMDGTEIPAFANLPFEEPSRILNQTDLEEEEDDLVLPEPDYCEDEDELPLIVTGNFPVFRDALDDTAKLRAMPLEEEHSDEKTDTLNIPPVDFSRSINDEPKKF